MSEINPELEKQRIKKYLEGKAKTNPNNKAAKRLTDKKLGRK